MNRIVFFVAVIMLIALLVGCDHTVLEGEIVVLSDELTTDKPIAVKLTVPDTLEDIHDVMWDVYDEEGNSLFNEGVLLSGEELLEVWDEGWVLKTYGDAIEKVDRIGVFVPTKEGIYTIEADGFYRQTNPQPITTIEIVIE